MATLPPLIAYGIEVVDGTIVSVIGTVFIFANGASHSFDFSSVVRVAREALISEPVRDEYTSEQDSSPAYLAAGYSEGYICVFSRVTT